MKIIVTTIIVAATFAIGASAKDAAISTSSSAPTKSSAVSAKLPCSDDVASLCKDIKPGGGAVMKCLQDNESKLSDTCKAEVQKISPCQAGSDKYCSGKHGSELSDCVKQHRSDVVATCNRSAKTRSQMRHRPVMPFCLADAQKFCKSIGNPLSSKVNDCLLAHQSELSPGCKAVVTQ